MVILGYRYGAEFLFALENRHRVFLHGHMVTPRKPSPIREMTSGDVDVPKEAKDFPCPKVFVEVKKRRWSEPPPPSPDATPYCLCLVV